MTVPRPALHDIEEFLARKRFAAVGVSRNPKDFTRILFREFRQRGYDVVPVNPALPSIEGVPCYARVPEIAPPVEGVLLLTSAKISDAIVDQCIQAGVRQVWMYRATGSGAVSERGAAACQLNGIGVIAGECPFMFLPHAGFLHRAHGFCRQVMGSYPG